MSANIANSSEFPKSSREFLASNANEIAIKDYFSKILEISESGDEFPVNLEDVWPIAYASKGNAVRDLNSKFIEGVDYKPLINSAKQKLGSGGQNKVDYCISISCLEFLIARKVRAVFDVYRQVFHQAIRDKKPKSYQKII